MKKVTIYDVAREAEVSLATVSRVINDSSVVKEDTKKRVQETIERLGYKPNAIAQGLALRKTTTIALVVPETSFVYTGQIINGLLDVAKIYKYSILLHNITEGITNINDVIDTIIKSRVDGVVIFNYQIDDAQRERLNDYDIPIVVIGNRVSGDSLASVFVDLSKVSYELVSRYLQQGIDDVVILQDRKNMYAIEQIIAGAKEAYKDNGKEFNNYVEVPKESRSTYAFLSSYFKDNKPRVVITNRDSQAFAAINAASENNIKIPSDLEVVCIIDTKYNSMVRPQISAYSIPSYDLGAVAMRLITKMLASEEEYDKEIELSYLYNKRQSTSN